MRALELHRDAFDFMEKLGNDAKKFRQVFTKVMSLLKEPRPNDSQELSGYSEVYRTDIGEFRIIYRFDDEKVYIDRIGKRNDDAVYKNL